MRTEQENKHSFLSDHVVRFLEPDYSGRPGSGGTVPAGLLPLPESLVDHVKLPDGIVAQFQLWAGARQHASVRSDCMATSEYREIS
jgi:hypothetical protein